MRARNAVQRNRGRGIVGCRRCCAEIVDKQNRNTNLFPWRRMRVDIVG